MAGLTKRLQEQTLHIQNVGSVDGEGQTRHSDGDGGARQTSDGRRAVVAKRRARSSKAPPPDPATGSCGGAGGGHSGQRHRSGAREGGQPAAGWGSGQCDRVGPTRLAARCRPAQGRHATSGRRQWAGRRRRGRVPGALGKDTQNQREHHEEDDDANLFLWLAHAEEVRR
jgi:hypothetical protein